MPGARLGGGSDGASRVGSASRRAISARQPGHLTYRRSFVNNVANAGAPHSAVSRAATAAHSTGAPEVMRSQSTAGQRISHARAWFTSGWQPIRAFSCGA
jgi:hypothetical protein